MAIAFRIKGNKDTSEYQDALFLKQQLEKEFSDNKTNGEILIISNATLFGQETKDVDIIVVGTFENYSCKVNTKAVTTVNKKTQEIKQQERTVYVGNFCFVIETKKHRAEDVQLNGLNLLVKYNNKWSDVTTQSENQKYSLLGFFKDRISFSPYICNFIWFRNVSWKSIKDILGNNKAILTKHNYLPDNFTFKFLMHLACTQNAPYNAFDINTNALKGYSSFNCLKKNESFDFNQMQSVFELFEKIKKGAGQLTRQKIEKITSQLLGTQQYAQAIGEKLIIISGRAGTGKTIKLLNIACNLALDRGARTLILTYNHALVSDIKRTLALAEIPDGVDNYSVSISTLHKYFYELLLGFGIVKNPLNPNIDVKYIPDYLSKYETYLQELCDYIDNGLIQEKEIQELMKTRHDKVAWDFVLIDESQDWTDNEKAVIFRIFGTKRTIIADGVDQLVKSQKKCNWTQGLRPETDFKKTAEKKGLRQEVNLVTFVNDFAKQLNIVWDIEPKQELIGGKIIISTIGYSKELHLREKERCKIFGNSEYEMLFLVPPKLVTKTKITNAHGQQIEKKQFKNTEQFKQMGIDIWDGTNTDLRTQYSVELTQHRLLQYESCRGLEGWTVICLELDEFIKFRMETFQEQATDELAFSSFDEKRDKFVYLWSLIPLTRAIDTLVITINNPESIIGKALKKVYEKNPDFVQWIE